MAVGAPHAASSTHTAPIAAARPLAAPVLTSRRIGTRASTPAPRRLSAHPARVLVRLEDAPDFPQIALVIEAAFGDRSVAEFAAAIRASKHYVPDLAFVAEEAGEVVGHTMLSYAELEDLPVRVLQLTPMSVRPDRQRRGIGSALVRTALDAADARGEPLVLVEGIPGYYPRFGFVSATEIGLLKPRPNIPEVAWMAKPLSAYDPSIRGRVVYPPWFPE